MYNDLSKKEITLYAKDDDYINKHINCNLGYIDYTGEKSKQIAQNVDTASYICVDADSVYYLRNADTANNGCGTIYKYNLLKETEEKIYSGQKMKL